MLFLFVSGRNYGSSIYAQQEALEFGCQQVLWLYGEDHQITEVGTMNLFLYWINEDGGIVTQTMKILSRTVGNLIHKINYIKVQIVNKDDLSKEMSIIF